MTIKLYNDLLCEGHSPEWIAKAFPRGVRDLQRQYNIPHHASDKENDRPRD